MRRNGRADKLRASLAEVRLGEDVTHLDARVRCEAGIGKGEAYRLWPLVSHVDERDRHVTVCELLAPAAGSERSMPLESAEPRRREMKIETHLQLNIVSTTVLQSVACCARWWRNGQIDARLEKAKARLVFRTTDRPRYFC